MEIEYREIDQEQTPLGTLNIRRYRAATGEEGHEILLDGAFLMATHGSHAERAMARLANDRLIPASRELTILVGGLGAGHTLRAALDLPAVERVIVAEIGAKVVDWNRRFFADVNGNAVDDPRVEFRITNVVKIVASNEGAFDLMLLDVDNGPGWLAAPDNARLYSIDGVDRCRNALRHGGVLAVWSPQPNQEFEGNLRKIFQTVEIETTSDPDEPPATIYLATEK